MPAQIVFNGKDQCEFTTRESKPLMTDGIRIRTLVSLMSTGTETIVLGRKFDADTNWDRWVSYPFYPGYSVVGEVVEVGADVTGLQPGMRVAARESHGAEHVVPAAAAYVVPAGIDPAEAAWFALAKIAFMGVKAGKVRYGSRVLVIGGGPIGQMTLRWCAAAGAEKVVLVDRYPQRLTAAQRGGATDVIGKSIETADADIKNACGGAPDIVIDSTGNAAVFAEALKVAGDRGTVVILGDTGTPTRQHLTGDVIIRGLTVIGAHDMHCDKVWTEARIVNLFFSLLQRGRFPMDGLNTHTFPPTDAAKAYRTAETQRAETMGILFNWSHA